MKYFMVGMTSYMIFQVMTADKSPTLPIVKISSFHKF